MFQVGQVIECVDDTGNWFVEVGQRYTVEGFGLTPMGKPGIHLVGVHDHVDLHGKRCPFYPCRFRPIVERKTDISIFKQMLVPSKTEPV